MDRRGQRLDLLPATAPRSVGRSERILDRVAARLALGVGYRPAAEQPHGSRGQRRLVALEEGDRLLEPAPHVDTAADHDGVVRRRRHGGQPRPRPSRRGPRLAAPRRSARRSRAFRRAGCHRRQAPLSWPQILLAAHSTSVRLPGVSVTRKPIAGARGRVGRARAEGLIGLPGALPSWSVCPALTRPPIQPYGCINGRHLRRRPHLRRPGRRHPARHRPARARAAARASPSWPGTTP